MTRPAADGGEHDHGSHKLDMPLANDEGGTENTDINTASQTQHRTTESCKSSDVHHAVTLQLVADEFVASCERNFRHIHTP